MLGYFLFLSVVLVSEACEVRPALRNIHKSTIRRGTFFCHLILEVDDDLLEMCRGIIAELV